MVSNCISRYKDDFVGAALALAAITTFYRELE